MDNSAPHANAQQETDDLQYTQETQQATQEASQEDQSWTNDSVVYWGCLQPCKSESGIEPIMFSRSREAYSLGRGEINDVHLRGLKISASTPYATLTWSDTTCNWKACDIARLFGMVKMPTYLTARHQ